MAVCNMYFFYFQGSTAISSADLFGHSSDNSGLDITTSDLINRLSFQVCLADLWFLCAIVNKYVLISVFILYKFCNLTHVWSTDKRNIFLLYSEKSMSTFFVVCISTISIWVACSFLSLIFGLLTFQAQQDISSLKNIAGETGKKLSSLASTLITDFQDRILWFYYAICSNLLQYQPISLF